MRRTKDIDQILDIYWGGSERRITGLTLRIIGVNALALVILVIGVLYLGQSQKNLIETKLETFQAEIELVSAALSSSAAEPINASASNVTQSQQTTMTINQQIADKMVRNMAKTMNKHLYLFDKNGALILDSSRQDGQNGPMPFIDLEPASHTFYSIEILKSMTSFVISFSPEQRILPRYPGNDINNASDNIDASVALQGRTSLSAWTDQNDRILLSGAAPIFANGDMIGSILVTRIARDIEIGIVDIWSDILRIFLGTLLITVILSIYLSGTIARPLKKLARAAERIRSGYYSADEIPDLSYRHDEIGELSLVLKDMTHALWLRMDSIESFAADVAHELKNPLTSLKSAVETAAIVKKDEDRQKLMGIIHHDVERLDRLITDISHASRLDTELSREIYEPVDIASVLRNLLDIYKTPLDRNIRNDQSRVEVLLPEKNIRIVLNIEEEQKKMIVFGIELRLSQVFQNLLDNALSFSNEGGLIRINAARKLNAIVITVEDEGQGIPENKLEAIFERFYTERPKEEDYGRHSGLGLSICRQIVEAHKGRIFAENKNHSSGKVSGAKFTVILSLG